MYPIRKIKCNEVNEALALALEVFMEFEAPDYAPEGVKHLSVTSLRMRNLSIIAGRGFVRSMRHLKVIK